MLPRIQWFHGTSGLRDTHACSSPLQVFSPAPAPLPDADCRNIKVLDIHHE